MPDPGSQFYSVILLTVLTLTINVTTKPVIASDQRERSNPRVRMQEMASGYRPTQKLTLSLRATSGSEAIPAFVCRRWLRAIALLRNLLCHCERPKGAKQSPRSNTGDCFGLRPRNDRGSFCLCRTALRCGVSRHDRVSGYQSTLIHNNLFINALPYGFALNTQ
jgi:hypothetical protein